MSGALCRGSARHENRRLGLLHVHATVTTLCHSMHGMRHAGSDCCVHARTVVTGPRVLTQGGWECRLHMHYSVHHSVLKHDRQADADVGQYLVLSILSVQESVIPQLVLKHLQLLAAGGQHVKGEPQRRGPSTETHTKPCTVDNN